VQSARRFSHRAIILALGDNTRVGEALDLQAATISYWKKRGIPPVYWPALGRLAVTLGVDITVEDLERSSPSPKLRRRCAA
jgi:hypothetical protein